MPRLYDTLPRSRVQITHCLSPPPPAQNRLQICQNTNTKQSCISEAQKYQGALYKEKPKRKSVSISAPSKHAYVEDAPEYESQAITIVQTLPRAPSPPAPSAIMTTASIDVFSYLVTEETPNASRISIQTPKEQMKMVKNAQSLFTTNNASSEDESEWDSEEMEYGADPVPTRTYEYQTPAPKVSIPERKNSSTDKKRKRQVEELDLTQARRSSHELDEEMPDVDESGKPILHSGLTGGLSRMLSTARFPPSPEYSAGSGPEPSPPSPAKRKRATIAGTIMGAIVEKRGRAANGQLVRIRKPRRASDESRPRKHHRPHKSAREDSNDGLKAIEYHRNPSPNPTAVNQVVVYERRAEMFLSFVTKGPESEAGCSMNKALKRYHRERGERGMDKQEEEKELFKCLRLKRNDRGEIVVILGE